MGKEVLWKSYNTWHGMRSSGVGVTKPMFSVPLFSTFSVIVKTSVSYWISRLYLAGVAAAQLRRHCAAATPVKYECDSGNLTGNFARSKILLTEKLANGALVTPTPDETMAYTAQQQTILCKRRIFKIILVLHNHRVVFISQSHDFLSDYVVKEFEYTWTAFG